MEETVASLPMVVQKSLAAVCRFREAMPAEPYLSDTDTPPGSRDVVVMPACVAEQSDVGPSVQRLPDEETPEGGSSRGRQESSVGMRHYGEMFMEEIMVALPMGVQASLAAVGRFSEARPSEPDLGDPDASRFSRCGRDACICRRTVRGWAFCAAFAR